jgi:2-amino-4-hydroxy-6-hydroxymethyldihydropteridine diphosphokinase
MAVRPPPDPAAVAIGIGTNLGDRREQMAFAVERLTELLGDLRVSSVIETEPVGAPNPQPNYLNAAATGITTLEPQDLLRALMTIERDGGRTRTFQNAARTLDLDLLLYGDRVISEPGLAVPHPRFRERVFVLQPLAEIAPGWRDPVTGHTISELLARLPRVPPAPRR